MASGYSSGGLIAALVVLNVAALALVAAVIRRRAGKGPVGGSRDVEELEAC